MCSFKNGRLDGIHNPQAHFLHPNTSCWRCLRGGVAQLLHNSTQRAVHFLFWKVQGFRWFTHTRTKKKTGAVVLFFKFLDKLPRSVCRNSSHASGTPPHATQASRVELLVDAHGEPHVELDDVRLLVVTGGVAGELEDLDHPRCCMRRYEGGQRWSPPDFESPGGSCSFFHFFYFMEKAKQHLICTVESLCTG